MNLEELRTDASTSKFAHDPTLNSKPFILALGRTTRRKGFHRRVGHRQRYIAVKVDAING